MSSSPSPTTLLIRLRPASRETPGVYPVEMTVDGEGTFNAEAALNPETFTTFEAARADAWKYGTELARAVFTDATLQRGLNFARGRASFLSVSLQIDAPLLQDLLWERLTLVSGPDEIRFATSTTVALSRRIPSELPAPAARDGAFRLLVLMASPTELDAAPAASPMKALDLRQEIATLRFAWDPLVQRGLLQVAVLARLPDDLAADLRSAGYRVHATAATLDALRGHVAAADGVHVVAHGAFKQGHASLLLENADGGASTATEDAFLAALDGGHLRLVFLQACQSATRQAGTANALSGLAPKVARRAAAVVAMQDFVLVDDARRFAREFYRALLSTGLADVAVNAGRQVLFRLDSGQWAIPALYLAPKANPVWQPDAVLQAVQDLAEQFRDRPDVASPFPVEVVRQLPGVSSKMETSPPGPRARVLDAVSAALHPEHGEPCRVVVIAGNYGRAKTAQLQMLYAHYASRLSFGDERLPLYALMSAFQPTDDTPDVLIAQAVSRTYRKAGIDVPAALVKRRLTQPFVLCLDDDQDADRRRRILAFQALQEITATTPGASAIATLDEEFLDQVPQLRAATQAMRSCVLVVQLLTPSTVAQYLTARDDACRSLLASIQSANLFDLAGVPWLLAQLLRQPTRVSLSRSGVIDRVVEDNFAHANLSANVQRMVEDACGRIAWALQVRQQIHLDGADLYELLDRVRGRREIPLEQLKSAALETKVLTLGDSDSVRFSYPGFQSYWCVRYLLGTPESFTGRVDDITATLGRRSRVRLWEDTLVLLAGMSTPEPTIRRILAGSTRSQGEHAFLAARCINEATLADRSVPDDLQDQVLDNLIWRSTPLKESSASARVRATESLGLLKHPGSIPHLISLAVERVRPPIDGVPQFELSSLRHAALQVLLTMRAEAEEHVRTRAAGPQASAQVLALRDLIDCWGRSDCAGLMRLFETTTLDGFPAIIAFALATLGDPTTLDFLVEQILAPSTAFDTQWSIADALLLFNPTDVTRRAIARMRHVEALHSQAVYMIGRLRIATLDSDEAQFVVSCLQSPNVGTRGTALRTLAQLGETRYRRLCEALATGVWPHVARSRQIAVPKKPYERLALRVHAIESLRLIGDEQSLVALRQARSWQAASDDRAAGNLLQLSYEVSEDIYWRLTGGLDGDFCEPTDRRTPSI